MANFSIQTSIQVIPLEEITFTDTSQKAKGIHSTIDKTFSASSTMSTGGIATNIEATIKTLPGTTMTQLTDLITGGTTIKYLYVRNVTTTAQTLLLNFSSNGTDFSTINAIAQNQFMLLTPEILASQLYFDNPNATSILIELITYSVT